MIEVFSDARASRAQSAMCVRRSSGLRIDRLLFQEALPRVTPEKERIREARLVVRGERVHKRE